MAVGDAHMFPGSLTPVLTQFSFLSHQLLFSHASAEVRGENSPERNFASTKPRLVFDLWICLFYSIVVGIFGKTIEFIYQENVGEQLTDCTV